jgi:hypothetical protein
MSVGIDHRDNLLQNAGDYNKKRGTRHYVPQGKGHFILKKVFDTEGVDYRMIKADKKDYGSAASQQMVKHS